MAERPALAALIAELTGRVDERLGDWRSFARVRELRPLTGGRSSLTFEAIIDWEIWSVGDPRVDLSWLTLFTDDARHPAAEPGEPAGTPTRADVVRKYEEQRGVVMPDLEWFHALTRYKEAAATGLLLKRAAKNGHQVSAAMGRMAPGLPGLVREAIEIVQG